ncbi:MAG: hypothetical protein IT438_10450 [Phycisphaerales bacterium]|nr:hypothetical protein [Phycisphaerales bacterium]
MPARFLRPLLALALATLLAPALPARADDIILDSFGPGNAVNPSSGHAISGGLQGEVAVRFVPASDTRVTQVSAFLHAAGGNGFSILHTTIVPEVAGLPGQPPVWSSGDFGVTTAGAFATFTSLDTAQLGAGQPYWLVIRGAVSMGNLAVAHTGLPAAFGSLASRASPGGVPGVWQRTDNAELPAVRIEGVVVGACGQWLPGSPFESIPSASVRGLTTEQTAGGQVLWAGISAEPYDQIKRYDGNGHWTLDIPIQNFRITAVGSFNGKPVFGYSIVGSSQHGVSIKTDIGGGWNTFVSSGLLTIRAFAQYGADLYAVGLGAGSRGEVWRFNGSTWSMVAIGNSNSEFLAAATFKSRLYVGGSFSAIASTAGPGTNATHIARFDGSSWSPVPGSNLNGRVTLLANHVYNPIVFGGSQLVAAGDFSQAGSPIISALHIASYAEGINHGDPNGWAAFGPGLSVPPTSFAARSSDLYAAGPFSVIGNSSLRGLVRWSAGAWQSTGVTSIFVNPIYTTHYQNLTVFGGGGISFMLGIRADKVMGYDGQRIRMMGSGTDAHIFDLAKSPDGGTIFAAGGFSMIENTPASHIAARSLTTPDAPWVPLGAGSNGFTRCVFSDGPNVYIGGQFTQAGTVAAPNIARWDGAAWNAVGTGGPNTYESVNVILMFNGLVTAIGASALPTPGVAQWNGTTWTTLGPIWSTNPYSSPDTACVHNGSLYIGGALNLPGSGSSPVARFNGSTWVAVGSPPLPTTCTSLASLNGSLYASILDVAGGPMVFRLDGNTWTGLSDGFDAAASVWTLRAIDGLLYAGGRNNYFAVLENGTTWRKLSIGAPTQTEIYDIEPVGTGSGGEIWLGTNFESPVPGISSWYLARYSNTPVIDQHPLDITTCLGAVEGPVFYLSLAGVSLGEPTFTWRKNGAPLTPGPRFFGLGTASLGIQPLLASDAGTYDCIVANDCGSTTSAAAALAICIGDANCSGIVSPQDLFDFLALYFASDPRADVNASGTLTVQDLFDFLAAYFTPCP